jgi:uncharacterized protein (TIGR00369 family)
MIIESEFEEVGLTGFIKHSGGLLFRTVSESEYQFKASVQDYHLNPRGSTHGGFIMSLLDSGMGTAVHCLLAPGMIAATISFDVKFVSASSTGDVIVGTARILKKTRSLLFVRGEMLCGDRLIATAEGVWKVL